MGFFGPLTSASALAPQAGWIRSGFLGFFAAPPSLEQTVPGDQRIQSIQRISRSIFCPDPLRCNGVQRIQPIWCIT